MVLATPRVVALCEQATCAALGRAPRRGAAPRWACECSSTTCSPHRWAATVEAEAVLEKIEGRRLTFMVSASDTKGLVAAGKVTRVLVEVDRFMDKTQ